MTITSQNKKRDIGLSRKTGAWRETTERGKSGSPNSGVKEDSHKMITILPVHNAGVELADVNERVEQTDRLSGPNRVITVGK